MKKYIFSFLTVLMFISGLLVLVGCGNNNKQPHLESIKIDNSSLLEEYDIDNFNLKEILLVLTYNDSSTEKIPLTIDMIDGEDFELLSFPGTHLVNINYKGFTTTLTLTMNYTGVNLLLRNLYSEGLNSGLISVSYEEWLDSIKGDDGISIINASINSQGELLLVLSNEEVVNAGKVIGPKGDQGTDGIDGKEIVLNIIDGYIKWQYLGDEIWNSLVEVASLEGEDGNGILSISLNEAVELIINYTDGTSVNLGSIFDTYQIQFKDYNGYLLDVKTIFPNTNIILPNDPIREGYDFIGWSVEDFSNISSDLIVYAQYEIMTFTITFLDEEGEIYLTGEVDYGSLITLTIPNKIGYDFVGWYMGDDVNSEQMYHTTAVKKDLTLYPRWVIKEYKLTFVDNDDLPLFILYVKHGATIEPPSAPTLEGNVFVGWNKDLTSVTSDEIIKALYEPIVYTITWENHDGTPLFINNNVLWGTIPAYEGDEPTRRGYTFTGWDPLITPAYENKTYTTTFESLYPAKYVYVSEDDFAGDIDGEFVYFGTEEYIVVPEYIRGVKITKTGIDANQHLFSYNQYIKGVIFEGGNNITHMDYLFAHNDSYELELKYLDTSNVVSMSHMFFRASAFLFNLTTFDTSNVVNMQGMFGYTHPAFLDLSSFDTSNVVDMSYMFQGHNSQNLHLSNFDTSGVTNMRSMFSSVTLNNIVLTSFDTTNVESMAYMFFEASINYIDISSFVLAPDLSSMFAWSPVTLIHVKDETEKEKLIIYGEKVQVKP